MWARVESSLIARLMLQCSDEEMGEEPKHGAVFTVDGIAMAALVTGCSSSISVALA